MFENKVDKVYGVHYSRWIMSWIREGGYFVSTGTGYWQFKEWLKSMNVDKDDIDAIMEMAMNGKMEFEHSAWDFIQELKKIGEY